jgi:hypothetical protein
MVLAHVLLTRFSYRDAACRAGQVVIDLDVPTVDPLEPRRLDKRFKLFELFCLPSVLAQTTKAFTWIVLIDPELKTRDRDRLRALTSGHRDTHLVETTSLADLNYLDWLRPYTRTSNATHVATTNVDDDDLFWPELLAYTQRHLRERAALGRLPSCSIVGCVDPPSWDFFPTRRAPFGYRKPWTGGSAPVFTGYTVCCKQPEYNVSALAFNHALGTKYFDPSVTIAGATEGTQAALRAAAERAGDDWRRWRPAEHLHVVHAKQPPVVVVNHLENHQFRRLFLGWSEHRPVKGPADFPGMPVAFDRVPIVIREFRRSPTALVRHLVRRARMVTSGHWDTRKRWRLLFRVLIAPVWFLRGSSEKKPRQVRAV